MQQDATMARLEKPPINLVRGRGGLPQPAAPEGVGKIAPPGFAANDFTVSA
jgi:hypothetical protein